MLSRALTLATILFLVASCGFQPLYGRQGENAKVTAQLQQTYVLPIKDRAGQILRNELMDRITPAGLPKNGLYQLKVNLTQTKTGVAIDKSASTNRYNLTLVGSYLLYDRTGKLVYYKGSARSIASYNVVESDFANLSAEKNAIKRASIVVADEIHRQLSVYFSR